MATSTPMHAVNTIGVDHIKMAEIMINIEKRNVYPRIQNR